MSWINTGNFDLVPGMVIHRVKGGKIRIYLPPDITTKNEAIKWLKANPNRVKDPNENIHNIPRSSKYFLTPHLAPINFKSEPRLDPFSKPNIRPPRPSANILPNWAKGKAWKRHAGPHANGSVNLIHKLRNGTGIIVHLKRGQRLENYYKQHGKFPNPVNMRPPAARPSAARSPAPRIGNIFLPEIEKGFNELGKTWTMSENSRKSAMTEMFPDKNFINPDFTVSMNNVPLFRKKLVDMGWEMGSAKNNSLSKFYRFFTKKGVGIILYLRGSKKNNPPIVMKNKSPTINDVIAYKKKFNAKPDRYNKKAVVNIYKDMTNIFLKNFGNLKNKQALAQSLYNKGNYKGYIKTTTKLLMQKKAANAGWVPEWKNTPPPVVQKPNKPNANGYNNVSINRVSGASYTAVGKLIGEKKVKDLRSFFKTLKIGNGIEKMLMRDAGQKFKVLARKNSNSNNNIPEIPDNRLRLDIFIVIDGKKTTAQFYATGAVVITGTGDKSDLTEVSRRLGVIKSIEIIRQSGTFYTMKRIPWAKATEFVLFCIAKKYRASYERELENYISVYAGKVGEKYKHHMKFYYNGQVGYSTSDLDECRKIVKNLLSEATKKGLTDTVLLLAKNNKPKRDKKKTTCANPPNPPDSFEGDCAPGYYCRPNAQGFPCCYKIPENLTVGRQTAIEAYKKAGVKMPEKVKKLLFVAFNIVPTNANKRNNVVYNKNKGVLIRKRACMRYSKEELAKFAKPLGIDWEKAKKAREGQRKKLPEGGWKQWLCDQMAKKLAANTILEERVSGSGSNSSRVSYRVASENEPILLPMNNRTHRLTIKPGPPIVISGFIRQNKRRKVNEVTSRVCSTLDRDVLERIARRVGVKNEKKLSKPQLCQAVYEARKQIKENYVSPTKPPKAKPKPNKAAPFRLVEAKPDGNCFYEAFLRGLTGGNIAPTAEQIQKLRNKVKAYYTVKYANRPNNNVVDVNINGKSMTKTQFMNYVTTNKTWAGLAEIVAVANKMSTNIIVLTPRYKVHKQFTVRDPSFQFTVYLRYNAEMSNMGTHFDTLIPVANGKVNFASASSSSSSAASAASSSPLLASSSPLFSSSSSGRKSSSGSNLANFAAELEANLGGLPKYH
jgi:hypothetical protein